MSEGQKNTAYENGMGWMILLCVFAAIFALFWYFYEFQVKSAFRWLRWGEMWLWSFFLDRDYTVTWNHKAYNFHEMLKMIPTVRSTDLTGTALDLISTMAMAPLRLPMAVVLVIMGMWVLLYGPGTQYRRKLNLDGLIGVQAHAFPVIAPFVKFNPAKRPQRPPGAPIPTDLPLFAEALAPEEWVVYNQIPIVNGKIDEQAAFVAFSQQLGQRWQGIAKMTPYRRVLMAAFCLKAVRKRKEADVLLGRIAHCWSAEKGLQLGQDKSLLRDAMRILRNREFSDLVMSRCNQHGFENTAILRALATAREEGGVLAPAQFVWLRAVDRNLWYPLNNLGRQSYHMEALGAMAHYKAERLTRRPIPKPKVHNAVQSVSDYMRSARARPLPPMEQKKKRSSANPNPAKRKKRA